MNKIRRKALSDISAQIEILKDSLDELKEEEAEYRDNMPENLQSSDKYEKSDVACDNLYEAVSNLEECISCIESATE